MSVEINTENIIRQFILAIILVPFQPVCPAIAYLVSLRSVQRETRSLCETEPGIYKVCPNQGKRNEEKKG